MSNDKFAIKVPFDGGYIFVIDSSRFRAEGQDYPLLFSTREAAEEHAKIWKNSQVTKYEYNEKEKTKKETEVSE